MDISDRLSNHMRKVYSGSNIEHITNVKIMGTVQLVLIVLLSIREVSLVLVGSVAVSLLLPILILVVALVLLLFGKLDLSTISTMFFLAVLPYTSLASVETITDYVLLGSLIWLVLVVIIGSFVLSDRLVGITIVACVISMITLPTVFSDVPPTGLVHSLGFFLCVAFLTLGGTKLRQNRSNQIIRQNKEILAKQSELELYTRLLRHDLKNSLQSIISTLEVAELLHGEDDEETLEMIVAAGAISEQMALVLSILSIGRQLKEQGFTEMLRTLCDRAQRAHKDLTIDFKADKGLEEIIVESSVLLPLVFENIFRNAEKYAGDSPTISVTVSKMDTFLQVEVADDGPGIDPSVKDRLFEDGVSVSGPGKGMGLFLSKRVVESYDGTIELIDRPGSTGAAFRITLKIA